MPSKKDMPAFDIVWGVKAISKLIGRTERQAFYMLEKGLIPGKKIGSRWAVSREVLARFFDTGGDRNTR